MPSANLVDFGQGVHFANLMDSRARVHFANLMDFG